MKKILVVGSSNIDFVVEVVNMPAVGETVMGCNFKKSLGGKGANQAYGCGKLGADTTFLSVVGDDDFGELLIDSISKVGVDTSSISSFKGIPTGMAVIYIDREGNNSIVVIAGANNFCTQEYIEKQDKAFQQCDIALIQMEIPHNSVYYSIQKLKRLGKFIILNPAPAPDNIPDEIYDCLDIITPNETELEKLSGCDSGTIEGVKNGCDILLNKGIKNVLVTLGSKGAMLVNKNESALFTPPDIKVLDTTAAGDTFNAAFAVMLAEGKSYHEAIDFANIAAAISVSRKGAQASIPSRQEVIHFREQIKK